MKQYLWVILITLWATYARAQENFIPDPVKKKVTAAEITGSLKVDGKLNEAEWALTKPITNFVQTDPIQGAIAKKQSIVRILYNKDYLYIGITCYDTVGRDKYRTLNLKRDFSAANNDFFAIAIDGYNDERNCMMFGMNPYGAQRDLLSFDDNYYDPDWDGLWILRTQRTDTAWTAEAAIPWKTLRYKNIPNSLQTWGISFGRIARSSNEFSNWPSVPRAYGGLRMPYAAKLVDINAPKATTNIRVQPYVLYSNTRITEGSKTILSKNTIKPGGDVKWAINPNTLLDLTFNTDFAQADVDRQVNNINRFSIFYPERRQFFLENAGLFTVGIDPLSNGQSDYSARIQPFFSRAIGLDANGNPLNIEAGARMVYRSDDKNIGGLFIRQAGNDDTNPANIFIGRYSQNLGKQNRIGALLSYKGGDNERSITASKNLTATVDGFFRFSQGLSWSVMGSFTDEKNAKRGYSGASQLVYNSNSITAWYNQSVVSKGYNPQLGFVARENVIITDPGFSIQERGKWLPNFIRAFGPGVSVTTYHNTETLKLTDRYININPLWFQFQNGGTLYWYVVFNKQNLESSFTPLGVNIGKGNYDYTRHKIGFTTDQSKKLSASLVANLGQFYDGSYNALTATLSFAPTPHLFISPNIELGKLKNVGTDQVSKDVTLYTVESRLALNPRLQLSGLFQKSNVNNSTGWNARFSWEFKPLSYFYIVFNNNNLSQTAHTNQQQVITKISYLKQF